MTATTTATVLWETLRDESLAAMTEAERAEYDTAAVEAEARLQLADRLQRAHHRRPLAD